MADPVRVQLSRQRGFRLQQHSMAVNGLPAVKVDRSTRWGNPWTVSEVGSAAEAVRRYARRELDLRCMAPEMHSGEMEFLRGKNLACWCRLDQPCHADVLLRLANPVCEEVTDAT